MKRKTVLLAAAVATLGLTMSPAAISRTGSGMGEYMKAEIERINDGFAAGNLELDASASKIEEFYLRNIWVRVRVPVGFEIPGIMKIQIIPETELLWQRALPEGWRSYRP